MVVEDDASLLELLLGEVGGLGYKVVGALSAKNAIDLFNNQTIDAALCDFHMPGMSGVELLMALRSKGVETPFIFLSGFNSQENVLTAIKLGAYQFLEKPFHRRDLQ